MTSASIYVFDKTKNTQAVILIGCLSMLAFTLSLW